MRIILLDEIFGDASSVYLAPNWAQIPSFENCVQSFPWELIKEADFSASSPWVAFRVVTSEFANAALCTSSNREKSLSLRAYVFIGLAI